MNRLRRTVAIFVFVLILLSGCKKESAPLEKAIQLRNQLLGSDGCSFRATITADYGDKLYNFIMDCVSDKDGNLKFVVASPETISGITGEISDHSGALTFDDKVLTFPTMAEGQITPVSAPWVFIKTLRNGYMNSCTKDIGGYLRKDLDNNI